MTTIDHGRKKPRIAIAEPTRTNHPEISTSRGRSMPTKASVIRSRAAFAGSEAGAGAARAPAIGPPVNAITESVLRCLGSAPPELARDLITRGIHMVGGGSLLRGLDIKLADATEVPVYQVDAPLECVVLGAGHCIESYNALRAVFMGSRVSG